MRKFLEQILDLRATSDFEKAKATISEGVSLKGYNLWILLCGALLASLGLDTNSTAVIIGAMLISPLMSPILGTGISVAVHDKHLLIRSLRNLASAVLVSLAASVLYFLLTPLGEVTPELQTRTFPTLLDVLIALFGGIAGIISISRRENTNAIPEWYTFIQTAVSIFSISHFKISLPCFLIGLITSASISFFITSFLYTVYKK
jgi:uncharacterized hydrophobic protein (TIGR00271 family)